MPAPLAKGIIITVSIIIAAGLAAYESPEIRKWVDNSRRKIAMALHSLGDEISPNVRDSKKHDPSMDEEKSDEAEERRRKAREEIMERGRILEERKKRMTQTDSGVGSFDNLVDKDGNLMQDTDSKGTAATATAVEQHVTEGLTKRGGDLPEQSARSQTLPEGTALSNYENELRERWNLPLPLPPITTAASETSHASESLLDLTPTSAEFPDPDISVPDPTLLSQHSEFFSVHTVPSTVARSRTLSPNSESSYYYAHPSRPDQPLPDLSQPTTESTYYYAHPSNPNQPLPDLPHLSRSQPLQPSLPVHPNMPIISPLALSSTQSVADTADLEHIHASELSSTGGDFSDVDGENGDGVRTPEGSLWTDVGSSISEDR